LKGAMTGVPDNMYKAKVCYLIWLWWHWIQQLL